MRARKMRRDKKERGGRVQALRAALKLSEWCRPPNLFPPSGVGLPCGSPPDASRADCGAQNSGVVLAASIHTDAPTSSEPLATPPITKP